MTIVHSKRGLAAVAAALSFLAGCSDPQGTDPGEAAATAAGESRHEAAASGEDGSSNPSGREDGDRKGGDDSTSADAASDGSGSGDAGGDGPRGSASGDETSAGRPDGSSGFMAAGEYVYDQKGYERFCNGPSCNKEPLPDTATVTATYESRSTDGATIVTESRSSEQQTVTTTTRHSDGAATITKVVVDFSFDAFSYSQTYEPRPPIVSLSYPLEVGKSWRGRWKAQTSGDYRMKVTGVSDGVYRIETVTNFRGDFSGRAQATVWVHGATRAIVRTDGQVAVASRFGEYTSDFRTALRSAPRR